MYVLLVKSKLAALACVPGAHDFGLRLIPIYRRHHHVQHRRKFFLNSRGFKASSLNHNLYHHLNILFNTGVCVEPFPDFCWCLR